MSTPLFNTGANAAPEPERKATPHTAVLDPDRRKDTGLKSGLISTKDALYMAYYPGIIFHGISPMAQLRLGDEVVFYEVAIRGKVYRALARPIPGQGSRIRPDDVKYSLARSWAPGLCSDGWLLDPPASIPNTPRALVYELQALLGLGAEEIIDNAYSVLNYRRHYGGQYPGSMEPAGYRLRELLLMSTDGQGNLTTLYETPSGVNPEKWTNFLRVLDRRERPALGPYAVSSMAIREYGEAGAAAMREALRLRDGSLTASPPTSFVQFRELFPLPDYPPLERNVGGPRR